MINVVRGSASFPMSVFQKLGLKGYPVQGDGSCLFHAVAHQAGFLPSDACHGDMNVSHQLRQLVVETMTLHPESCEEDGLTELQWAKRKRLL